MNKLNKAGAVAEHNAGLASRKRTTSCYCRALVLWPCMGRSTSTVTRGLRMGRAHLSEKAASLRGSAGSVPQLLRGACLQAGGGRTGRQIRLGCARPREQAGHQAADVRLARRRQRACAPTAKKRATACWMMGTAFERTHMS